MNVHRGLVKAWSMLQDLMNETNAILKRSFRVCKSLFSLMVPVTVGVKLLNESGILVWISPLFSPIMTPLGLPGEYAIVWISAMLAGLYGGLTAYFQLPDAFQGLTVNQATTLSMLMLTAHALVIELKICHRAGGRIGYLLSLRVLFAIVFAWLSHVIAPFFIPLGHVASMGWERLPALSWSQWIVSELFNYAKIAMVIVCLVALLRFLDRIGFSRWLQDRLSPVLRVIGISPGFAPLIVVGMMLGLAYGGALIIDELQARPVDPKDIVMGLTFMSLCHSLVEDTLVMALFGGNLIVIFVGRLLLAFVITWLIHRLFKMIGYARIQRWTMVRGFQ